MKFLFKKEHSHLAVAK